MLASIILTLNDDEKDFITRLVNEYGDQMYSKALSILKNESDAEDAVQETFLKIIKYINKFEGTDSDHKKMLAIINFGLMAPIKNTALSLYRKNKNRENKEINLYYEIGDDEHTAEPAANEENIEDIIISKEEYQLIKNAVLRLPQDLQSALYLVYSHEFTYVEASDFLGISLSALKDRIYRAKLKLKKMLEEIQYE